MALDRKSQQLISRTSDGHLRVDRSALVLCFGIERDAVRPRRNRVVNYSKTRPSGLRF